MDETRQPLREEKAFSKGQFPLTQYLYQKASAMGVPLNGAFELSPVCNFNCRMCYIRKSRKEVEQHPRKIMQLEDWLRIAKAAQKAGTLYLLLTGGEPLLWPDFWTLYDELVDMGFLVSINTNGSLIDEAAIAHFKRKPPHKINITLYGAGDDSYLRLCGVTGMYSKVTRAIEQLTDAGITVKLNCSLTPENAEDLDRIVDYAKAHDLLLAVTTYMFPPIRRDPNAIGRNERFSPEDAAGYMMRYLRRQRGEEAYQGYLGKVLQGTAVPPGLEDSCVDPADGRVRCRAGKASFWITWDGWLQPCGMMPEPKTDLKEKDFLSAWNEIVRQTAALHTSSICESCPDREICRPCAAMAHAETGSSTGIPVYQCQMTKEIYRIAEKEFRTNGNSCCNSN